MEYFWLAASFSATGIAVYLVFKFVEMDYNRRKKEKK